MPAREVGFGREESRSVCCFSAAFGDAAERVVKRGSLPPVLSRTCASRPASPIAAGVSSKWTLAGMGRVKVHSPIVTEPKVGYQVVSCLCGAPVQNFISTFCTVVYHFILL